MPRRASGSNTSRIGNPSAAYCTCPRRSRSTPWRGDGRVTPFEAMSSRVTVVIPNWNGRRFLSTCLGSLRRQSFENFETVLVDNGSTDDSVAFVRRNFPEVQVFPLGGNIGITLARNGGIRACPK